VKRDPALVPLSHDHHKALYVAQQLQRANAVNAAEARSGFTAYWREHGARHFEVEERVLFPAYAPYGDPHHPLLARALCDHVDIRARAAAVTDGGELAPDELNELGARLADHVRMEERELFPLIEEALPPERLAALSEALAGEG
jgi:hemerythrin-like domain-containing protein